MVNNSVSALYRYIHDNMFHRVWNSHLAELRNNIVADCLTTDGPVVNSLVLKQGIVKLPDDGAYYVFEIPTNSIIGYTLYSNEWKKVSDILTSDLDLRFTVLSNGLWLFRDLIYLASNPFSRSILIAVNYDMVNKCRHTTDTFTDLLVSVYHNHTSDTSDTDGKTVTVKYYYTTTNAQLTAAISALNASVGLAEGNDKYTAFINGREAFRITNSNDKNVWYITNGDYVEIITDNNVVKSVVIDMTDADQDRHYSNDIGTQKYILHVSKEDNPNQYVFTHNTVDFFIRPAHLTTESATYKNYGLFIHRNKTNSTIGQLTHQDYWINTSLISAYREALSLSTNDVKIRVVLRNHNTSQKLITDANYLKQLYTLSDNTICTILEGRSNVPSNLSFWTAKELEKSEYNKIMFGSYLQLCSTETEMKEQIKQHMNAVGYYNMLTNLTNRVIRYIIDGTSQTTVINVDIPYVLRKETENGIGTRLFINGDYIPEKANDESINYETSVDNTTNILKVTLIADNLKFYPTDIVVIELYNKYDTRAEYITPNSLINTINLGNNTDILVYRVFSISQHENTYSNGKFSNESSAYYQNVDNAYQRLTYKTSTITNHVIDFYDSDNLIAYTTSDNKIIFTASSYDNRYLVTTKEGYVELDGFYFDIDDTAKEPLLTWGKVYTTGLILSTFKDFSGDNSINNIPFLWDACTPITNIGERELSFGIDISCPTRYSVEGNLIGKVIHINSANYKYIPELNNGISGSIALPHYVASRTPTGVYVYSFNNISYGKTYVVVDKGYLESKIGNCFSNDKDTIVDTIKSYDAEVDLGGIIINPSETTPSFSYTNSKDIYLVTKGTDDKYHISTIVCSIDNKPKFSGIITSDDIYNVSNESVKELEIGESKIKGITGGYMSYFQPNNTMITVKGKAAKNIISQQGYIKIDDVCQYGDLVSTRSMVPDWLTEFIINIDKDTINQYQRRDLERQLIIIDFLNKYFQLATGTETHDNHQTTSIILDMITKDIVNGKFNPNYDTDRTKMMEAAKEYLASRSEDDVLIGANDDILVVGSSNPFTNSTYHLKDYKTEGIDRVWKDESRLLIIDWSGSSESGYWQLRSYDSDERRYWRTSGTTTSDSNPWDLTWIADTATVAPYTVPAVTHGSIDRKYININEFYTLLPTTISKKQEKLIQLYKELLVPPVE